MGRDSHAGRGLTDRALSCRPPGKVPGTGRRPPPRAWRGPQTPRRRPAAGARPEAPEQAAGQLQCRVRPRAAPAPSTPPPRPERWKWNSAHPPAPGGSKLRSRDPARARPRRAPTWRPDPDANAESPCRLRWLARRGLERKRASGNHPAAASRSARPVCPRFHGAVCASPVAGRLSKSEGTNREVRSESREVERSAERECEPGGDSESVLEPEEILEPMGRDSHSGTRANGSALSCRQGPPPWRTGAPMFDARLYRG
jgi:hypothetical protein